MVAKTTPEFKHQLLKTKLSDIFDTFSKSMKPNEHFTFCKVFDCNYNGDSFEVHVMVSFSNFAGEKPILSVSTTDPFEIYSFGIKESVIDSDIEEVAKINTEISNMIFTTLNFIIKLYK